MMVMTVIQHVQARFLTTCIQMQPRAVRERLVRRARRPSLQLIPPRWHWQAVPGVAAVGVALAAAAAAAAAAAVVVREATAAVAAVVPRLMPLLFRLSIFPFLQWPLVVAVAVGLRVEARVWAALAVAAVVVAV